MFHQEVVGIIKTVTLSKTPSDKYFASILCEKENSENQDKGGKTLGVDLGLKDFAIVHDGEEVSKYSNPKLLTMGGGNPVPASGACVRPNTCKGKGRRAMKLEADTSLTSKWR